MRVSPAVLRGIEVCQDAAVRSFDVIVVTHNHRETVGACLRSLTALEGRPATVVVVDNASTDESAAAADRFADELPLRVVLNDENVGFSAAVNRALRTTRSAWVLLLNPDCALRPGFVGTLFAGIEASGDVDRVGSATGKLRRARGGGLVEEPLLDAAGLVMTPAGRHFDRGSGESDGGRFDRPAWVFGGTGAATLFRREALEDVCYPDGQFLAESFFAFREDAELAWRLQLRGWRCLYVPGAVGVHRRGLRPERGRRQDPLANLHSVKNRFLLRMHCAGLGWHVRTFPWWLARDLAVVGACLTVERSSLPGLAAAWRLRRDALARRRWVRGRARVAERRIVRWFRKGGWVEGVATT